MNRIVVSLIASVIIALALLTPRASAQLLAAVTAQVALDELQSRASEILSDATDRADYVTVNAAIQALNVLDRAEAAYGRQLSRTVNEVEGLLDRLNEVDAVLDGAQLKLDNQLEDVSRLQVDIAQMTANIPGVENGPYIVRVLETVFAPNISNIHRFTIEGVDLHEIRFDLRSVQVSRSDNQSFVVELPAQALTQDQSRIAITRLPLTLIGDRQILGLGPRRRVRSELTLGLVPPRLATISYTGRHEVEVRQERSRSVSPGQFRGTNDTKAKWVRPTEGWRVDITRPISVRGSGGNQGRCEGYNENNLSENGIELRARLDRIRPSLRYPGGAPGRIECTATFTEYRLVRQPRTFEGSIDLLWTREVPLELPDRLAEVQMQIAFFDGTQIIATGARRHKFLEIRRDGAIIVFRPIRPNSLR